MTLTETLSRTPTVNRTEEYPTHYRNCCIDVGCRVKTVEEIVAETFNYTTPKVGEVYMHYAYDYESIYVGQTWDYSQRKNSTEKKQFITQHPSLLLVTDNVVAVENGITTALDAKNSIVYKQDDETYDEFYHRVLSAFIAYEEFSIKGYTNNFARLISLRQHNAWRKNRYVWENADYLYLDNPVVEESDYDTDWHGGYERYYDYTTRKHQKFLRIPIHMRIKTHERKTKYYKKEKELAEKLTRMHDQSSKFAQLHASLTLH